MDLSIIIVNHNVKYFLEQCLYSVRRACKKIDAEIFVVDNASSDGSREYLEGRFKNVKFIWNEENVGFGRANNSVLRETTGRYVLFLNPDTIIAEDTLELCIAFADEHKAGGLGICMVDGSGSFLKESKRSFPSASASIYKMTGIHAVFPRSRLFAKYYAGHISATANSEIDVLAGAFMMVSRKAIDATGGFDEDFFMYGEDIDLSYRITKAGFKNYYFADSTIIHFKGESTQRISSRYIKHFYGAMKLYVKKHVEGKWEARSMLAGISLARRSAAIKHVFRSEKKEAIGDAQSNTLAIVAGQQRFNDLIQLIKHSVKPLVIKGRITISQRDSEASIGKLNDIEQLIKSKAFNHLIFCEGEITNKDIISLIRQHKNKAFFLFNEKGSNSIVGSSKKEEKGWFITYSASNL